VLAAFVLAAFVLAAFVLAAFVLAAFVLAAFVLAALAFAFPPLLATFFFVSLSADANPFLSSFGVTFLDTI
jgi:hypothetical protein